MPRKCISGFAEAGAAMAQQLDDNDLLNLFSAIGRIVSKRFLLKRPSLDRWQLVIDYLTSAMAFQPREQFRVLYLDKGAEQTSQCICPSYCRCGRRSSRKRMVDRHGVSAKSPRITDRSGSVRIVRVIGALGRPKGRAEREREPVLKEGTSRYGMTRSVSGLAQLVAGS